MNPFVFEPLKSVDSPLIVALDYDNEQAAMSIVSQLDPALCKLKIGKELFTACGPNLVEKIVNLGYKVFLDLKFHDIPNTVYKACKAASDLGIWMINVHTAGGPKMLEMSRKAIDESSHKPLLIGVTVLTSIDQQELNSIGIKENLENFTTQLAQLGYKHKLDGVVCSGHESIKIKQVTSEDFLTICPGIRLTREITDDQTRIMTPIEALKNKVDYLVIGRPITQSSSPIKTMSHILSELKI